MTGSLGLAMWCVVLLSLLVQVWASRQLRRANANLRRDLLEQRIRQQKVTGPSAR